MEPIYWLGPIKETDDFGEPITDTFIDGKTLTGRWAIMSPMSYLRHGVGMGPGKGQRYLLTDGKWLKIN